MIPSRALSITALLLTLIVKGPTPVSAQGKPPGTAEMAFASIQDQTLYVQGGYSNTFTDQFYALNLTKDSWSPLSPPWTPLTSPPIFTPTDVRVTISNGMTVTKDQKRLVIWAGTGVFWFNLETSLWDHRTVSGLAGEGILYYSYRRAATDGETGLIYIPSAAQGGSKMVVLDPDTLDARTVDMPPTSLISAVISLYGWIWSDLRKSFIFTGGEYTSLNNDRTLEYFPGNDTWSQLTTFGAKIPAISRHCMVSGYNGRKMVLYGGQEFSSGQANLRGAIFVLDVPTLTWTQGPNVPTDYISADMACTITGSNFISWGGSLSTRNRETLGTPVIFDIDSMTWMENFNKNRGSTGPLGPTGPNKEPASTKSSNNTVVIAAGCAGAALVLVLVGLFFWMRRRRANASAATTTTYTSVSAGHGLSTGAGASATARTTMVNNNGNTPFGNARYNDSTVSKGVFGHDPQLHAHNTATMVSPFTRRDLPTVHTSQERNPQHSGFAYQDFMVDDTSRRNPQLGAPTTNSSFY